MNPWLELVIFNLGFLGVFLLWLFLGEWWETRGGEKALPRSTMISVGVLTAVTMNIFGVIVYLGSS